MHGRKIDASWMARLDLLTVLQDPAVELSELQGRIALDVRLSVRLLRFINSAYFGLDSLVRSIAQAIALLGTDNLRRWASLTLFAERQEQSDRADDHGARRAPASASSPASTSVPRSSAVRTATSCSRSGCSRCSTR